MKKYILILGVLSLAAGCVQKPVKENTEPAPVVEEMKTYTNTDIGITFEYPAKLGSVEFNIDQGSTGKKYVGVFIGNRNIQFGGLTKDYTAGRGGYFLDSTGFTEKNGQAYFKFVGGNEIATAIDRGIKAKNTNGILIKGYAEDGPGSPANPGLNSFGAVFNLKNPEFPGIAFLDGEGSLSKEEFVQMLESLEIK